MFVIHKFIMLLNKIVHHLTNIVDHTFIGNPYECSAPQYTIELNLDILLQITYKLYNCKYYTEGVQ